MSQNIEIEFKNMLTKDEYEKLMEFFQIKSGDIFSQENHYFDTPDFALKAQGSALRIRYKSGRFVMTLKQPCPEGLLETNQSLTPEEANQAITTGKLPEGMVKDLVRKMNVPFESLEYFGSLVTERSELPYEGGLLVFDHSYYLNKEDFELEYEVENYAHGEKIFRQFLKEHNIPKRETKNKIYRFYLQKSSQNTTN